MEPIDQTDKVPLYQLLCCYYDNIPDQKQLMDGRASLVHNLVHGGEDVMVPGS